MEANDLAVCPAKRQTTSNSTYTFRIPHPPGCCPAALRSDVLRALSCDYTGQESLGRFRYLTMLITDSKHAQMHRAQNRYSHLNFSSRATGTVTSVVGKVHIPNLTSECHTLNKHFYQISPVFQPDNKTSTTPPPSPSQFPQFHSAEVSLDPNNLLPAFTKCNSQSFLHGYDQVFDANLKDYNSHPLRPR